MNPVVAVIAPGAMGSAVAKRLTTNKLTVLTTLEGRSEESISRAQAAGMMEVPLDELGRADIILSIVPPGEALAVAQHLAPMLTNASKKPVYADCNAVNPRTLDAIAEVLKETECPFVDGSIIGGPPKANEAGPTFYLAGDDADVVAGLSKFGLSCRVLGGAVGAASALKMSYGGITKGLTALGSMMILAASDADAADALRAELKQSQPMLLAWFDRQIPSMFSKAYRWVSEMQEVAGFVEGDHASETMFEGIAEFYDNLAQDFEGTNADTNLLARFCTPKSLTP